ncbi:Lysophosphatidylcholine acyltransferase 1 [Rhynchospora pubera]|uniref:Lysophosphatidylcholine acyltransferase 1 n=1 Tax=Rhynchospora pubera TaxID=906938 RepID=A0AAV8GFE6_9POAL|nr:Lysophosphatidylcholine acyltransferase 1 [Rhynchospora pubera]
MELKSLDSSLTTTAPKETETETEKDKDERSLLKSSSSSASYAPETLLDELDKKYAPYARKDAFGPMGRGPVPFSQRVLVALAALTLLPLRFISGVLILFLYFLICRLCTLTLFSNHQNVNEQQQEDHLLRMTGWRRHAVVQAGRLCARAMLFVFGFYWILIEDRSHHQLDSPGPGAIVSNHVSYVDILYHMSSSFPSFVAKASVAKLPLVGLISKCLACIYVQRESKSTHSKGVSAAVTDRVQQAHQNKNSPMMLLFPEGTTTNGDYLLPFKSGAFLAKAPVVPIILRYPYKRFSPAWDSMSGMRHLFLLLCQFVNYIEVIKLPVYYPSEEEKEDPRLYANNVRKLMATEGNLILSEIGLSEKRVYHAALNGNSNSPPRDLQKKED